MFVHLRLHTEFSVVDGTNRAIHQLRGQDAQHLRPRQQALGAEAAAQEGTADMDILRRDAEQFRRAHLRHG